MDKNKVLAAIKNVRENSKKRNFEQSFDLIINLTKINLKNADENIDSFLVLPHKRNKEVKVCAFVDKELENKAKIFDIIKEDEFPNYVKDKKALKDLTNKYDFFIAQASLMGKVASVFGKVLGPKGKMPNPKSGCVVTPDADLLALKERLNRTIKVRANKEPIIKCFVGSEKMEDNQILDNIMSVYNTLIHQLPQEEANIKGVMIKLTMGPTVKVGVKERVKK